ncbi:hypothetical protein [Brochothrix thermosphacta]|nr:hypothetical protein [Brochothrix thermosphacta]SPN72495.1 protein of unknown function [Brochothrix thermosphacta]
MPEIEYQSFAFIVANLFAYEDSMGADIVANLFAYEDIMSADIVAKI